MIGWEKHALIPRKDVDEDWLRMTRQHYYYIFHSPHKKLHRSTLGSKPYIILMASLLAKLIWFFITSWIAARRPLFSFEDFFCVSPETWLYPSSNGINLLWSRGRESKNGSSNWKGVIERKRKTWVKKENQFLTTQFQVFWWISNALQQN